MPQTAHDPFVVRNQPRSQHSGSTLTLQLQANSPPMARNDSVLSAPQELSSLQLGAHTNPHDGLGQTTYAHDFQESGTRRQAAIRGPKALWGREAGRFRAQHCCGTFQMGAIHVTVTCNSTLCAGSHPAAPLFFSKSVPHPSARPSSLSLPEDLVCGP